MDVIRLIESVRKYPLLYDVNLSHYLDQKMRQEAWEKVGIEVKIAPAEAKAKWHKLRRCFCNAINRRNARKSGGQTTHKRKTCWKFEQKMSFLLPFMETKSKDDNVEETEFKSSEVELKIENFDYPHNKLESDNEKLVKNVQGIEITIESPEEPQTSEKKVLNYETGPEQESVIENHDSLRGAENERKSKQLKWNWLSDLDETDMFFLSMAKITKDLPRSEQSKIKLILSNAVLQADIKNQSRQGDFCGETYAQPECSCNIINNYNV